ncbi:MAG: hypothetical protein EOM67_12340 [Spirochaetia bacterium]|nr:hypothetical protein [Spirochaetia bacterium]
MNFIDKSQIMQGIGPDSTADILEKGINHKYYKREGTPGNYKYYYTKEEYDKAKGREKEDKGSFENKIKVGGVELTHTSNIIPFYKELKKEPEKYKEAIKMLDDLGSEWDKVNRVTLASKVVNAQNNLNNRQVKEERFDYTFFDDYPLSSKERQLILDVKNGKEPLNELTSIHDNSSNIDQKARTYLQKFMNKEDKVTPESEIKVGQSLKVPSSLTSDPSGKKGQFGKVTSIEDDIITLKFSDGKTGKYDRSIW